MRNERFVIPNDSANVNHSRPEVVDQLALIAWPSVPTAKENERLAAKLDVVNDSIFALETQILEARVNSEASSELGPLKYLSELTGVEMNRIINWLLLIIIFVW